MMPGEALDWHIEKIYMFGSYLMSIITFPALAEEVAIE